MKQLLDNNIFSIIIKNKEILTVTVLNIISRVAYLILFLAIGNIYGISRDTEVIFFLYAPLVVIMSICVGVTDVVVMPTLHKAHEHSSANYVQKKFFSWAIRVVPPITILSLIISYAFIDSNVNLMAVLLLTPIPLLSAFSSIYIGILNSNARHKASVLGPIYGTILALPLIFILNQNLISLAFILLMFECGKVIGLRIHSNLISNRILTNDEIFQHIETLLKNAINAGKWQVVGSLLISLNIFIDIQFANFLGSGSVTKIEYTNRLWNVVPLFFSGLIIITYAKMSRDVAKKIFNPKLVYITSVKVFIVSLLLSLLLIGYSDHIVKLLFGYGVIKSDDLSIISKLLSIYLLGSVPFVCGMIYSRAFSAHGRVKLLAGVAFISVIINFVFNYLLISELGIYGIAYATVISHLASLLLFIYFFVYLTKREIL